MIIKNRYLTILFLALSCSVVILRAASWSDKCILTASTDSRKSRSVLSIVYTPQIQTQCIIPIRPPIDSVLRLMTLWRITGKIIKTAITVIYAQL